jgi:hypothetical protein
MPGTSVHWMHDCSDDCSYSSDTCFSCYPCCRFMATAASSAAGTAVAKELQAACALLPRRLSLATKVLPATGDTSSIKAGLEQVKRDLRRKVGLSPQTEAGGQGQTAEQQRSHGLGDKRPHAADSGSDDETMPPSPPLTPAPSPKPEQQQQQQQQQAKSGSMHVAQAVHEGSHDAYDMGGQRYAPLQYADRSGMASIRLFTQSDNSESGTESEAESDYTFDSAASTPRSVLGWHDSHMQHSGRSGDRKEWDMLEHYTQDLSSQPQDNAEMQAYESVQPDVRAFANESEAMQELQRIKAQRELTKGQVHPGVFLSADDAGIIVSIFATPGYTAARKVAVQFLRNWQVCNLQFGSSNWKHLMHAGFAQQLSIMLHSEEPEQQCDAALAISAPFPCSTADLRRLLQLMSISHDQRVILCAVTAFRPAYFDAMHRHRLQDIGDFTDTGMQQLSLILDTPDNLELVAEAATAINVMCENSKVTSENSKVTSASIKHDVPAKMLELVHRICIATEQKQLSQWHLQWLKNAIAYLHHYWACDDSGELGSTVDFPTELMRQLCKWLRLSISIMLNAHLRWFRKFPCVHQNRVVEASRHIVPVLAQLIESDPTSDTSLTAQQVLVDMAAAGALEVSAVNMKIQWPAENKRIEQLSKWYQHINLPLGAIRNLCGKNKQLCQAFIQLMPPSKYSCYITEAPSLKDRAPYCVSDLVDAHMDMILDIMRNLASDQPFYARSILDEVPVVHKLVELTRILPRTTISSNDLHRNEQARWLLVMLLTTACPGIGDLDPAAQNRLAEAGAVEALVHIWHAHNTDRYIKTQNKKYMDAAFIEIAEAIAVLARNNSHVQQLEATHCAVKILVAELSRPGPTSIGHFLAVCKALEACCPGDLGQPAAALVLPGLAALKRAAPVNSDDPPKLQAAAQIMTRLSGQAESDQVKVSRGNGATSRL